MPWNPLPTRPVPSQRGMIYIPRSKVKKTLDNRDYLYGKLIGIIRERRKEIEEAINENKNTELRHDILTSFITANTPYDINSSRHVDPELSRPMTDDEIRADMLDIFLGGTDTVSIVVVLFCFTSSLPEDNKHSNSNSNQFSMDNLGRS
ncbi:5339_t:CDS:2 [Entrophospora sp. SA101]|nr:5744_t:CDS:2 [Entrophospora sp. SA101]CAJ0650570.1 5339_t:CDS:2 [Entrophospora sp. SA101]CAJ0848431.1 6328_t:CDS:2 [Entrophospora sp. SA101]